MAGEMMVHGLDLLLAVVMLLVTFSWLYFDRK
jgi:hypothetical protein